MTTVDDDLTPYESAAPEFSDDYLAEWFVGRHGGELRYVTAQKVWMRWDGQRWVPDETGWVLDRIRIVCRDAASLLGDDKRSAGLARSICSNSTMRSVERIAARHTAIATSAREFDDWPGLLNTPGGIVTLWEASITDAQPEYRLTKMTAVSPSDSDTQCLYWLDSLNEWTSYNSKMIDYLQRIAGYWLCGGTSARAIFLLHSPKNEGASMFLETLQGIMGDYAVSVPMETFLSTKYPRHPTEVAMMQGKRLVTAIQAERKTEWNLSRLIALADSGSVSARFMHADFFQFKPTAKLAFRTVHMPAINGADEDVRQLFHVIPFSGTVRRNRCLPDQLWHERPAILRWATLGYLAYCDQGLNPPPAALEATHKYVSDPVDAWIAARCDRAADLHDSMKELWESWLHWCRECREPNVQSQQWLAGQLMEGGFDRKHTKIGNIYLGLRVRQRR